MPDTETKYFATCTHVGLGHRSFIHWLGEEAKDQGVKLEIVPVHTVGEHAARAVKTGVRSYEFSTNNPVAYFGYDVARSTGIPALHPDIVGARNELTEYFGAKSGKRVVSDHGLFRPCEDAILIQGDTSADRSYLYSKGMVVVPTSGAEEQLAGLGQPRERIRVTGFLAPTMWKDGFADREARVRDGSARVLLVTSGASPKNQIEYIREFIEQSSDMLRKNMIQLIVSTSVNPGWGFKVHGWLNQVLPSNRVLEFCENAKWDDGNWSAQVYSGKPGQEMPVIQTNTALCAGADVVATMANERMCLALTGRMFLTMDGTSPNAKVNQKVLAASRCALLPLDGKRAAEKLNESLRARGGELWEMAVLGHEKGVDQLDGLPNLLTLMRSGS